MTYDQVVHESYGTAHKTVPYYVAKDPTQVAAVIVTQHTVCKYNQSLLKPAISLKSLCSVKKLKQDVFWTSV